MSIFPGLGRLRQEGCYKFEHSLGYVVHSRLAWAIAWESVSSESWGCSTVAGCLHRVLKAWFCLKHCKTEEEAVSAGTEMLTH